MSHGNARLTFLARMDMVQQVATGWPQAEVARQFRVSRATVAKWVRRYREEGESGLHDRSSRPRFLSRLTSPAITEAIAAERKACAEIAWNATMLTDDRAVIKIARAIEARSTDQEGH